MRKKNKLMKFFYAITGGRPMKMVEKCRFVDVVVGKDVGVYEDRRDGTQYLAFGPWDIDRMKR